MGGISISIGADYGGLRKAVQESTAQVRQLSQQMRAAMAPTVAASRDVARSIQGVGSSAGGARSKLVAMARSAADAGQTLHNIVQGAKAVRSIWNFFSGAGNAAGLIQKIRHAATSAYGGLRQLASSPAFRRIAVGAVAAGAAVLGVVVAGKTAAAGLRGLRSVANSVFEGMVGAARSAARAIGSAFSGIRNMLPGGGGGGGMGGGGGGLASMFGPIAALVGVGGAMALIGSQIKGAVESAEGFEATRTRIESFTGSVKDAAAIMQELTKFSTATPFLASTEYGVAEKLLSAGIDKSRVAGLTKNLGAVSSSDDIQTELGEVMARGFAKAKFQTRELNEILNRGINIKPELQRIIGATGDAFDKAVEKGLRFDDVAEAIARMSQKGGLFYGVLLRMSGTWRGLVSTLIDNWEQVRRAFMQPILDAVKPMLKDLTAFLASIEEKASAAGKAVADAIISLYAVIKSGKALDLLKTGLNLAFLSGVDALMRGCRGAVAFLAASLPPIFQAAIATLKDPAFWLGVQSLMRSFGQEILSVIHGGLGREDDAKADAKQAAMNRFLGMQEISKAGNVDFSEVIQKALSGGGSAAMKAAGAMEESAGLKQARSSFSDLLASVGEEAQKLRDMAKVPPPEPGARGNQITNAVDGVQKAQPSGLVLQTALGRINGGGYGQIVGATSMVSLQQRTVTELTMIRKHLTSAKAHGGTAHFAR